MHQLFYSLKQIRQPKLTLQAEDYKFASHRKSLEKLKKLIETIAHLFYYISDAQKVSQDAEEIVEFETKLAKVSLN